MECQRTVSEVMAERRNAVGGGCCDRFADQMACDCLKNAVPDPVEPQLTAVAAYRCDHEFRGLVDVWVSERRCPVPLVDRCLELGLDRAADCARWASTQPDRSTPESIGPNEKRGKWGPYPTQNTPKHGQWFWRHFTYECCYVPESIAGSMDLNLRTPLDAILWLLDNWVPEEPT